MKRLFTSESVTEGHPDKMCDQISDAILDAIFELDPYAHVACETATKTGFVLVFGELSTSCYVDIEGIVRKVVKDIGYDRSEVCFDGNTCAVLVSLEGQSPVIAMGVDEALEVKEGAERDELAMIGAGDQGMMFGFACDETPELMPMPISLAHKMAKKLAEARKIGKLPYLRPDGKTQVTVEYDDDRVVRVDTVVVSTQHSPDVPLEKIRRDMIEFIIKPIVPKGLMDENTKIFVNPTGRFVIGGPQGDSGLTGRQIIVDTYGGYASHGGGAFSGKAPTKVDRSAAYMARYIATNLVAAGIARKCEVQLAYAIGVAEPVSVYVNTYGTGKLSDDRIVELIRAHFDMRPAAIIKHLDLRKPIYRQLAAYGHLGREDLGVRWEDTDKAADLAAAAGI
ncbi:MAG: methionine adenosyltransferase [Mogibacterium sp.]|nr:methionine adenosyltransferase [Mogibacterium sp.]